MKRVSLFGKRSGEMERSVGAGNFGMENVTGSRDTALGGRIAD